jgi:hypothetical protein
MFASAAATITEEKSWSSKLWIGLDSIMQILGHPTFAKFMAVPHYAYLMLKIPGPKGTITVQGSFEVSNTCDKEFNKLAQTFGMIAEYARLKGKTDHNVPLLQKSLPVTGLFGLLVTGKPPVTGMPSLVTSY